MNLYNLMRQRASLCADAKIVHSDALKITSLPARDLVLDKIYQIDTDTLLPKSDVGQFMSDSSNPELAAHLREVLRSGDGQQAVVAGKYTKDIGDDGIIDAMPQRDSLGRLERLSEYGKRIKELGKKSYDDAQQKRYLDKLHDVLTLKSN